MGNVWLVAVVTLFLAPALQIGVIRLTMRWLLVSGGRRLFRKGVDERIVRPALGP